MLSPAQLGEAGDAVAAVYTQIEAEMLDHLVETMVSGDVTSKTAGEIALLAQTQEAELRRIVAEHQGEISDAVLDTVERFLEAADADDRERMLTDERKAPAQIVATAASLSAVLARGNLAMAEGARRAFLAASVEAVTKVNAGFTTTDKAVHAAVRKLTRDGIDVVSYQDAATGKATVRNKVDVAVRRHVRTQISQAANDMAMARLDGLSVKLVEVSSHADARPSHAEWQGRCYSLNGEVTIEGVTYPDFYLHCMSGTLGDILGGVNCRHSFGPYRHGAPRRYEPDPKHPSGLPGEEVYEYEQKQRLLERRIREAKRELRGARIEHDAKPTLESRASVARAEELLKKRQAAMRDLVKEANGKAKPGTRVLTRKPNREWAGDMPKGKAVSASHRKVDEFLDQKSVKAQLKASGISKARMKAEIAAEMQRRDGSLKDFASLSRSEQQSVFGKVRSAIDAKMPSTKKANAGKHADKLAGVVKGEPMPFDKANGGRVNPKFSSEKGYKRNCQTCVVAFEARLRGYDVTAKAREYSEHAPTQILARDPRRAWVDPSTGKHPPYIQDASATTPLKAREWFERTVKPGERYTIKFKWNGNQVEGHVINLDRNEQGVLRFYDPQSGKSFLDVDEVTKVYTKEEIEHRKKMFGARSKRGKKTQEVRNPMLEYLSEMKYTATFGGSKAKLYDGPQIFRIDNMDFNRDIVDKVLEGA